MILITDRNCVALQMIDHYQELGLITGNIYDAKVLLTWSDIPATENKQVKMAKELGIKTLMIAHGRNCSTNYDKNYKDIITGQECYPLEADIFMVWGQRDKDRLKEYGDRIKVVGCPLLVNPMPVKNNGRVIVHITHHDHSRQDARIANETIHSRLLEKYGKDKYAYQLLGEIKTVPKYTMVVSPQMDNEDIIKVVGDLSFGVIRIESLAREAWVKMISVLIHAKCVVSASGGSFEGLAMAMDIPVIRVKADFGCRNADGTDYVADQKGVELTTIDDMIDTIENLDPKKYEAERKEIAVNEMGLGLNAYDNMIKEIDQWL